MKTYTEFLAESAGQYSKIRNKLSKQKFITNDEYDSAVKEIKQDKSGASAKDLQNQVYDLAGKLTASMKAGHPGAEKR